jgi:hypothetical protein
MGTVFVQDWLFKRSPKAKGTRFLQAKPFGIGFGQKKLLTFH